MASLAKQVGNTTINPLTPFNSRVFYYNSFVRLLY